MYKVSIDGVKNNEPVALICDECGHDYCILLVSAKRSKKKHGRHVCKSCSFKFRKNPPQNTKEYWTVARRLNHGQVMKSSENYQKARKSFSLTGPKNGMYGKRHSAEARSKMSKSRIGKTGENATAWKGGKTSINRCVKGILHTRFNWYANVYKRDDWTCRLCNTKAKKIDAHHIEPISKIIKRLSKDRVFGSVSEEIDFLVSQEEIIDSSLTNGITLCRSCHKNIHANWGSHNPVVLKDIIYG